MANVKFDWTGVDYELRAKVKPILDAIYNDPTNKADINAGYNTVTIKFANLGGDKERGYVSGNKGGSNDGVVTFNLDGLSIGHNGQPTYDYGGSTPKLFSEVAVHENVHLIYPNLSADSFHNKDDIIGQFPATNVAATVATEFAFRTVIIEDYQRIFGAVPQSEFEIYKDLVLKMQIGISDTRSINWMSKSYADIVREIDNPSSDLRKFLPSSATSGTRDERTVPSSPYTNTDIGADGSIKSEQYRADGTIEVISGTDASGNIFTEGFDALGTIASYVFKSVSGQQLSLTGDGIGSVLGSSIGSAIGGKNFATKVVTTTLIGSLGQTLGGLLNIQGNAGKSLIAQVGNCKISLDDNLELAA